MVKPSSPASLPPVQLPEFEGPLDLLLEEVRRQNVAIENIAMAPIMARFLDYIHSAAGRNLNLDMEWLHMAATLIHWKSLSLLPADPAGGPPPDPIRDHLVQQLLMHRKEAAGELARLRAIEQDRFSRPPERPEGTFADSEDPRFVSAWDLIRQAREIARWVEEHRQNRQHWQEIFAVEQDEVTVGEMIDYLQHALAEEADLDAVSLLERQPTVARRSCLFLGMLEMARNQQVELMQEETLGPLRVRHISRLGR